MTEWESHPFGNPAARPIIPPPTVNASAAHVSSVANWEDHLERGKRNAILSNVQNVALILHNDPEWSGCIAFDEFQGYIVKRTAMPVHDLDRPSGGVKPGPWTDLDSLLARSWFARHPMYAMRVGSATFDEALRMAAARAKFHPVIAYLVRQTWDRVPRLDTWLSTFLGAVDNEYTRAVGRWCLLSAVARVAKPGCKVDTATILEGMQGAGKSTIVQALAGDWFSDAQIVPGEKDGYLALRGRWIVELGELSAMSRSETNSLKAFMSSPVDRYRPPYGRTVEEFPRQSIFIGTTNGSEYLQDTTGNRRWLPVRCGTIDRVGLAAVRDQLWAEAFARFRLGELWYPNTNAERAMCGIEQEARRQIDPWEHVLASWIVRGNGTPPKPLARFTMVQALGALGFRSPSDYSTPEFRRAAACLDALGWERRQIRVGNERPWFYVQKATPRLEAVSPPSPDVTTSNGDRQTALITETNTSVTTVTRSIDDVGEESTEMGLGSSSGSGSGGDTGDTDDPETGDGWF